MSEEKEEQLKKFVMSDGRICPQPNHWHQLYKMLSGLKAVGSGSKLSPPLILGAWPYTSAVEKQVRFHDHIRYAAEHGILDQVDRYLRDLRPDQWYCINKRNS